MGQSISQAGDLGSRPSIIIRLRCLLRFGVKFNVPLGEDVGRGTPLLLKGCAEAP